MDPLTRPIADLPPVLALPKPPRTFDGAVTPPGSKSLTNRALLLAALAPGRSVLRNPLVDGEDALVMIEALRLLGATVEEVPEGLAVTGVDGRWRKTGTLNLSNAGTAARFLAA